MIKPAFQLYPSTSFTTLLWALNSSEKTRFTLSGILARLRLYSSRSRLAGRLYALITIVGLYRTQP